METDRFYNKEIRQGYTITEKQKKVWAVQLAMLDEVDRICKKYDIRYFADSGTLIGAVREKGYIPWDDDIDLVMLRPDYERFAKTAQDELKAPLVIQTAYTEENYLRAHIQIRNSETTGCNAEDIKAGYNCGIFIDIFPLDAVPDNKLEAAIWAWRLKTRWSILYTWYRYGYYEHATIFGKVLYKIGRILNCPLRSSYAGYERLCKKYALKDTKYVCDTVFIKDFEKNTWERSCFDSCVDMPFENRIIPVPAGYDMRLKQEYGDYMKPAKAPTEHGELIIEPEIPWRTYMSRR